MYVERKGPALGGVEWWRSFRVDFRGIDWLLYGEF